MNCDHSAHREKFQVDYTTNKDNCIILVGTTVLTVLSCLVGVGGVNWIGDKSRLSETENFESEHVIVIAVLGFVLSRPSFQFATVQFQIYWGLLKTVLSCRQLSTHRWHGEDKTVLSCPCRRCELSSGIHPRVRLLTAVNNFVHRRVECVRQVAKNAEHSETGKESREEVDERH